MFTNKQLTELIRKELNFLAGEVFCFAGCTIEPDGSKPETYRWIRDESVQIRTDRMYWLAKKFPQEYSKCTREMGQLRPSRTEDSPANKKVRNIRQSCK